MNRTIRLVAITFGLAGFLSYSIPLNSAAPGLNRIVSLGSSQHNAILFSKANRQHAKPYKFPPSKRHRQIDLNFEWIDEVFQNNSLAQPGTRILLPLFEDVDYVLIIDRIRLYGPSKIVFVGHVDGIEASIVILSVVNKVMAGTIEIPGGPNYRIRSGNHTRHWLLEVEPITEISCDVGLEETKE